MKGMNHAVPQAVVQRLTKYLAHVQTVCEQQIEWVSSGELAATLGLTSSTVRQDLSYIDFSGTSKRGYETTGLRRVLRNTLGCDKTWRTVVVGAGNLGRALAQHEDFARRGFQIVGIFDNSESIIGSKVGNLTVQAVRLAPKWIGVQKVEIGIIAVPSAAAQEVGDILIASGVRGLLNLSLAHIVVPRHVSVIDSRVVASLMELTHAIKFAG